MNRKKMLTMLTAVALAAPGLGAAPATTVSAMAFPRAAKKAPEQPGNYAGAEENLIGYLTGMPNGISAVPYSFFHQSGNKISLRKELGVVSDKTKVTFCFVFGREPFSPTQAFTAEFVYRGVAHDYYHRIIEFTTQPSGVIKDSSGELEGQFKDGMYVFTILLTDKLGSPFLESATLTLTPGVYLSRACVYCGPYVGFRDFAQKVTENEKKNLVSIDSHGVAVIESSVDKPVYPAMVLDSVMAYDEYEKRYIRPVPVGSCLEEYAAALSGISSGSVYTIELQAEDNSGNKSFITVEIRYLDYLAPVITVGGAGSCNEVAVSYTKARTAEELLAKLRTMVFVSDDVAQGIIPEIHIADFKEAVIGKYPLTIKADDGVNIAEWNGNVSIIDNIPPEITGPQTIFASASAALDLALIPLFEPTNPY